MNGMEIKVCSLPLCIDIFCWEGYWTKIIDIHVARDNDNPPGMLTGCSFHACTTSSQALNFCTTIVMTVIPLIASDKPKGCFLGNGTNRPSPKSTLGYGGSRSIARRYALIASSS